MSLVNDHRYRVSPNTPCFYCDEAIGYGLYVDWHGSTVDIALHPRCAEKLGAHLIKDGLNGAHSDLYEVVPR